jgi:hypothetical protein
MVLLIVIKNHTFNQCFATCLNPMMDWTTKDYRFFARLFNPNVVLYTEMVTTGAILLLRRSPSLQPFLCRLQALVGLSRQAAIRSGVLERYSPNGVP